MADNVYVRNINQLISEFNEVEIDQSPSNESTIYSLHNHLGNLKHILSDISLSFNATDKNVSTKVAEKELKLFKDDLFELHQIAGIKTHEYEHILAKAENLDYFLRSVSDTDFI